MENIIFECDVKPCEHENLLVIFNWCVEKLDSVNTLYVKEKGLEEIWALEDRLTEVVKTLPKLKFMKVKKPVKGEFYTCTIAQIAASLHMYKLLEECCKEGGVFVKDNKGFNVLENIVYGFNCYATTKEDKQILTNIILSSLKNEEVFKHKGYCGKTLGAFCVPYLKQSPELKPVVELYKANTQTAQMQDDKGRTILNHCEYYNER